MSSNQQPQILLIGAPSWLTELVSELFFSHEIKVDNLTVDDFLSSSAKPEIYKTLWWLEFNQLAIQTKVLRAIKTNQLDKSVVLIGELPEEFLLENELSTLVKQQQFLTNLSQELPDSQQFFVRDLLEENQLASFLKFSFRGYQQTALLDPQDKWYPVTKEGFFKLISPYLTRPHSPKKAVVQGDDVMSGQVLVKLADLLARYYHQFYEVVPVMAERQSSQVTEFVTVTAGTKFSQQLDQLVRNKDQWQAILKELPSPTQIDLQQLKDQSQQEESAKELEEEEFLPLAKNREQVNQGKKPVNQQNTNIEHEEQLEGKLAKIFAEKRGKKSEERIDNKVKIVKKITKKSKKNKLLFNAGMTTMVLGGIVLLLWGIISISTVLAKRELASFFASTSMPLSQSYQAGFWSGFLAYQTDAYQAVLGEDWLGESGDFVAFERALTDFQQQQQQLDKLLGQYLLGVMTGTDTALVAPADLQQQISLVQAAANQTNSAAQLVFNTASEEPLWLTELGEQQQQLALASQIPASLGKLLGSEGKQTYAVLLQNNLELRPTGGFLQAIALFTFDQGLLVDTQLVNTYDLDKQVLASVLAPAEIKKYLGEDTWYLRDSNWNPDFPQAAQRVAWFIRQASGVKVDGVWALNYYAFEDLIAAFESLPLTEYDELLTKNNLLERVEFHSGDELSSAGGKDYALLVFNQLIQRLRAATPAEATRVVEALGESLNSKQMLVSFFSNDLEETARLMGWNGEIINPVCPARFSQGECLVDQLFQVEANVGLNRVGDYIKRKVDHEIDLSGGKVTHSRLISLENTAKSDGWPLGTYRVYLRFILDGEAQPKSLTVNGKKITGDQLNIYGEGGRRVIGTLVEVPKETITSIELVYTTEDVPTDSFSYLFFDQKQPGVEDTNTTITIYNPNDQAVLIAPTAEIFGDSIEFKLTQHNHLFVGASF